MQTKTFISLPAPAKLNLFLHITGRREDGYHNLQTLFQLLDWGDTVHLERTDNPEVQLTEQLPGVAEKDNIAVKAALKLQQYSGCQSGAQISIDKHIPMGGGLGGGSSNAASTLLGLNYLWSLALTLDELVQIGLELGADVPVFIRGENCLAEGVGEILTPIILPKQWYLVIKPPVNVETATIFCQPQLTRDSLPIRIPAFFETGSQALRRELIQNTENVAKPTGIEVLKNDCMPVAIQLYPEIAEAIDWLNAQPGIGSAKMTGTGACVFSAAPDQKSAEQALKQLPAGWQGFISQSSQRSTAHEALDQF